MDSRNKQIPRPKHWQEFEELCLALFREVWKDSLAQKNGRAGQPQHGVDVWGGIDGSRSRFQGVQCKGKDESLGATVCESELVAEITKADKFSPALEHWILATTAPTDGELQRIAREISVDRERQGKFTVQVMGWGDIESLLFSHPTVIEAFYPELGVDAATLARAVQVITGAAFLANECHPLITQRSNTPAWREVLFDSSRDIGPALLGRPLGPTDALACPRLPEADLAIQQMEMAYSARLIGEPGTGKSVCAFQVAHTFATRGWRVFALRGANVVPENLPTSGDNGTLLLVDDAHLVTDSDLRVLEGQATSQRLILSTHSAIEGRAAQRGAVRMDPQAAIRAIATGLLADRRATLEAVRRADGHVGDLMMDVSLEERIEHAAKYAAVPWQFCFVLGGGWRRANEAAITAGVLGAALPLAAVTIRQLASRDSSCSVADIAELLTAASADTSNLGTALDALVAERLVISANDLRCPHQRFAAVLLGRILQREDEASRAYVAAMLNAVVTEHSFPLAGLRTLLHDLWFVDDSRWRRLIRRDSLESLLARCWKANDPSEVMTACFVLTEIASYLEDGIAIVLQGNESTIVSWIEHAINPMGHGLARLLNDLLNKKEELAIELTRRVNPMVISSFISNIDAASVGHVADLAKSLRLGHGDPWAQTVLENLDREKLLALAASWPTEAPLYRIISLFEALVWPAEALTLDMVEVFLPTARKRLIEDPVVQFRELDDLAWHVLRVLDPLGVYTGKYAPTARHIHLARMLFDNVDLHDLARKLTLAPLRMFQQVTFLLALLRRVSRPKFKRLVKLIDWDVLGVTIGEHWRHLPHDAETLIGVAASTRESWATMASFVRKYLGHMETMPPRLAVIAPDAAVEFVRGGKSIALASYSHVAWNYGEFVIALFLEKAPELLPPALAQCIPTIAKAVSEDHPSWYKESSPMLKAMLTHAPDSLQLALDLVSADKAAIGWKAALEAGGRSKRTVDVLLQAARDRTDAIGDLARQLRRRRKTRSIG
ncbi:hypothetical protein NAV33_12875 [Pseudomonas stutzeri]|uniref:hypothetical protein n=1 Tax=Stutzerimonas stutzeri TaxID=316 RepID=UPI00210BE4A7|nr:hypothetical protein [Stutzerimonas stutzeri]MCQ4312786.1 hypothetical protein [Stutzerimonas stutzeri]